jgi:hypothetical protein
MPRLINLICAQIISPLPLPTRRAERGQASVEYALVLLGAAILASLLIAWASRTKLLDDLLDYVMSLVKGKADG